MTIKPKLLAGACAVSLVSMPLVSQAQGFEGGEVTLSFGALEQDTSQNVFTLEGSANYGISGTFGAQVDLVYRAVDESIGDNFGGIVLHGVTSISPNSSLGAFIGYEYSESGDDETILGLEAIYETEQFSLEGYIADFSTSEVEIGFGLTAEYKISSYLELGLSYDRLNFDGGTDLDSIALRGTFGPENGYQFYAEVGQVSAVTSETFFGIGATYHFGSGATFSRRSSQSAFGL